MPREALQKSRRKSKLAGPDLTTIRRFLKCKTHTENQAETRGRKRTYSRRSVLAMDKARKILIEKADGEEEVHWPHIQKKARAKEAHRTTIARSFIREGIPVGRRVPRQKPLRGPEHERERMDYCARMRKAKKGYFFDKVDMFIDNKTWKVPATVRSRKYLKTRRVRFHLRTPGEGLKPGFTKPSSKKHAMNTGGSLSLVAGISNCKVVVWSYIDGAWNGEVAAGVYRGPIFKALRRNRGQKARYHILEDNDPTGYKSTAAIHAKDELKITTETFPRYSPDLNPLDYFLWEEVEKRMKAGAPKRTETTEEFNVRLRKTAMAIPQRVIRAGISSLGRRIEACFKHNGGHIPRD